MRASRGASRFSPTRRLCHALCDALCSALCDAYTMQYSALLAHEATAHGGVQMVCKVRISGMTCIPLPTITQDHTLLLSPRAGHAHLPEQRGTPAGTAGYVHRAWDEALSSCTCCCHAFGLHCMLRVCTDMQACGCAALAALLEAPDARAQLLASGGGQLVAQTLCEHMSDAEADAAVRACMHSACTGHCMRPAVRSCGWRCCT